MSSESELERDLGPAPTDAELAELRAMNGSLKKAVHEKEVGEMHAVVDEAQMFARPAQVVNIQIPSQDDVGLIKGSLSDFWERLGIARDSGGNPLNTTSNVLRCLDGIEQIKGLVWTDSFHHKMFTRWRLRHGQRRREWEERDTVALQVLLQTRLGFKRIGVEPIEKAIIHAAAEAERNEVTEWMDTLVWDGKERIERCFVDIFGADDNAYHWALGLNFWTGLAARAYRPGCKLDNMVILYSEREGTFKSTAWEIVGGEWYAEIHQSVTEKDFLQAIQGRLIVEIAELIGFSRADRNRIKGMISCRVDRFREAYGHHMRDYPRGGLWVGTTNDGHFLDNDGDHRRLWPITIPAMIDLERLKEERAQLYAEGIHRFKSGADWWVVPPELARDIQDQYRVHDAYDDMIADYLRAPLRQYGQGVTVQEIAVEALRIELPRLDMVMQRRIGGCLRRLGRVPHRMTLPRGEKRTEWMVPQAPGPAFPKAGEEHNGQDPQSPTLPSGT